MRWVGLGLTVVRDLRVARPLVTEEDLLDPKTAICYAENAKALLTTAAVEEHPES